MTTHTRRVLVSAVALVLAVAAGFTAGRFTAPGGKQSAAGACDDIR